MRDDFELGLIGYAPDVVLTVEVRPGARLDVEPSYRGQCEQSLRTQHRDTTYNRSCRPSDSIRQSWPPRAPEEAPATRIRPGYDCCFARETQKATGSSSGLGGQTPRHRACSWGMHDPCYQRGYQISGSLDTLDW